MAGPAAEKEPKNIVHQYAILDETVAKEKRYQKLFTNLTINPYKEFYAITGKVNRIEKDQEEDAQFREVVRRSNQRPNQKYNKPQTEAHEIGWMSTPLIQTDTSDKRLNFHRCYSSNTKFMEKFWQQKEQQTISD